MRMRNHHKIIRILNTIKVESKKNKCAENCLNAGFCTIYHRAYLWYFEATHNTVSNFQLPINVMRRVTFCHMQRNKEQTPHNTRNIFFFGGGGA